MTALTVSAVQNLKTVHTHHRPLTVAAAVLLALLALLAVLAALVLLALVAAAFAAAAAVAAEVDPFGKDRAQMQQSRAALLMRIARSYADQCRSNGTWTKER